MEFDGTVVSVQEILSYVDQDRYLDKRQAAEYTGLSTRTLESRLDEIPHFRVGKKILFKKSELDHWIEQFRESSSQDFDAMVDDVLDKVKTK